MKKVLITGGGGMLAHDLKAALAARGDAQVVAPTRAQLDVTNAERRMPYPSESGTVRLYIEATRPSVSEPPAVGIDELPETSMDGT